MINKNIKLIIIFMALGVVVFSAEDINFKEILEMKEKIKNTKSHLDICKQNNQAVRNKIIELQIDLNNNQAKFLKNLTLLENTFKKIDDKILLDTFKKEIRYLDGNLNDLKNRVKAVWNDKKSLDTQFKKLESLLLDSQEKEKNNNITKLCKEVIDVAASIGINVDEMKAINKDITPQREKYAIPNKKFASKLKNDRMYDPGEIVKNIDDKEPDFIEEEGDDDGKTEENWLFTRRAKAKTTTESKRILTLLTLTKEIKAIPKNIDGILKLIKEKETPRAFDFFIYIKELFKAT